MFLSFYLLILSGCSDQVDNKKTQNETSESVAGGIYHFPLSQNPATLDPINAQGVYSVSLVNQIFDGLVRFDKHLSIKPAIAKSWQIKDSGKLYKFFLGKNILFHNLDPVTSEDVNFSIKRLLRSEPAPAMLPHLLKITGAEEYRNKNVENVIGFEIENESVFKIHLKEPHVPFLTALGMYQAAIVPKKELIRMGENFAKHPIGTGPFKLESWDEKKSINLKRFEKYYAGPAFLDGIQYKIYQRGRDPSALSDFRAGKLEEITVYGDIKEKLADKKNLQWFHRPSLCLFFYGMNIEHPNLKNPDLRKALSIAIDRQAFVNQVYNGQFDIAKTILPPGMPGYTPLNQIKDSNLDLARQHLNQRSAKSIQTQPELEIVSSFKTPRVEQEMEMMKGFWSKLGLKIRVKYITDWEKFEAYLRSDTVQIYRYGWFADIPDPDSFLYSLFASESQANFMNLKDKNIDQMLSKARGIIDPVKRANFYHNIESNIMDLSPLIPLFHMGVDRVYQPYVKSVKMIALGPHNIKLNKIWLDKPRAEN